MTDNDGKSYLGYLNKLVDEYNNTYHCSIGKKPIDSNYSIFIYENESSHKVPKFEVSDRVRIAKYKNILSKGYTKNWLKEIFVIDSVLKSNPWTDRIKDLKGEVIIGSFY